MNTLIIGPSKIGKTSFVACVDHAANVLSYLHRESKEKFYRIESQNDDTQALFVRALDLLKDGLISIPGTSVSISYDFSLQYTKKPDSWWKRLFSTPKKGRFQFMDGPGGAIFSENQDKESDRSFQAIRDHIQKAQGLMVCVDSTQQLSHTSSNQDMHRYYNDNIQYLLTHSYSLELPFQRISFVLTKADLYAQIMGHEQDAEKFLLMVDPLELVFKLIGKDVFRTIIAFSPYKNVLFQFSFSSVYGFTKGALHTKKERLNAEDWMPYNVVENFAFLLTGEKEHPCQHLYSIQDIEKRI